MTKKPLLLKAIKLIVLSIIFATNAADAQEWKFAYQVRNNMTTALMSGEYSQANIYLTQKNDGYYFGLSRTSQCLRMRATKVEYTKEYLIITPTNRLQSFCDIDRFIIRLDGTGGAEEFYSKGSWIPSSSIIGYQRKLNYLGGASIASLINDLKEKSNEAVLQAQHTATANPNSLNPVISQVAQEKKENSVATISETARSEQQRIAAALESQQKEQTRIAQETRLREQDRLLAEQKASDLKRLAEESNLKEQQRIALESQQKEQTRIAQETRLREQERSTQLNRIKELEAIAESAKLKDLELAKLKEELAITKLKKDNAVLATSTRKALVIGNDNYSSVTKLLNARHDANAVGKTLTEIGYKVVIKNDLNEKEMKATLRQFKNDIEGGDEVVIFYAGHGVQIGSTNYLLPTDIKGESEDQVRDDAIQLQRILDDMNEKKVKLTLAIIDACRDNPFPKAGRNMGSRGLAPTTAATGQMIIFSAGSGQQALDKLGPNDKNPNGLFTRMLLNEMKTPAIRVDSMIREVRRKVVEAAKSVGHDQVPSIYDQVVGDFYLNN